MNVHCGTDGGVLCVVLDGENLDAEVASQVRRQVAGKIDGAAHVVVDLSGVAFIDSSGLGALVGVHKAALEHGRRAVFAGARPRVREVIRRIKLDQIFELHADVAGAVRVLQRLSA